MYRQPSPASKEANTSDLKACYVLGCLTRDTQASYRQIPTLLECKITIAYLEVGQAQAGLAQALYSPQTGWKCPKLLQS